MLDGVEGIGEDDASITQSSLEDRPTSLLCPLASDSSMIFSKLEEIAEQWYARYLGEVLDLWCVGTVEIFDEEEAKTENEK